MSRPLASVSPTLVGVEQPPAMQIKNPLHKIRIRFIKPQRRAEPTEPCRKAGRRLAQAPLFASGCFVSSTGVGDRIKVKSFRVAKKEAGYAMPAQMNMIGG